MYAAAPSPPQQWNQGWLPNRESMSSAAPTPVSPIPAAPGRTGRLRGLSYLRSYTQNHILSRDSSSSHHHQNHNHNHNQNHDQNHNSSHPSATSSTHPPRRPATLARSTSYPAPASARDSAEPTRTTRTTTTTTSSSSSSSPTTPAAPSDIPFARISSADSPLGSTSGWLPTVGGQSAVSRIATEPQSTATDSSSAVLLSGSHPSARTSDHTASMARTRTADGAGTATTSSATATGLGHLDPGPAPATDAGVSARGAGAGGTAPPTLPSIRFSAHQDPRAQRPSLIFSPMARILPTGKEVIKVGRYSERDNHPPPAANVPSSAPVGFKSKVVSRRHCEFWCAAGRWFIRDVKSSSGTFLNHIRLSSPGTESKPFPINDGDIVQLGIDFKGGEEMIFRCVKIRIELNKGWQNGPSSFNVQAHKRLRELNNLPKSTAAGSSQDCSICLGPIAPCQSLFVAPCSHTWHYKCIRVIINGPMWPHFTCPNCRDVSDLEAELDDPFAHAAWEDVDAADSDHGPDPQPASEAPRPAAVAASAPPAPARPTTIPDEARLLAADDDDDHRDVEHAEHSDDSAVERDGRGSPLPSSGPEPSLSHATVAAVHIVRKPVGRASSGPLHLGPERRPTRTPSPTAGAEGPMTPRNDVGPFVFDGSAGGLADGRLAEVASQGTADTPPLPPRNQTS